MKKVVIAVTTRDERCFYVRSTSDRYTFVEDLQDAKPMTASYAKDVIKSVNSITNTNFNMWIKFKGKLAKAFLYDPQLYKTAVIKEVEIVIK